MELDTLSAAREAVKRVLSNPESKVLVFTGAGCSADSKIPTFRGAGANKLWSGVTGALALALFGTPFGWRWMPQTAWEYYVDKFYIDTMNAECHKGHICLREFEKAFRDAKKSNPSYTKESFTLVTMNVDNLHQKAGSKNVLQVHGTLAKHRCTRCQRVQDLKAGGSGSEGLQVDKQEKKVIADILKKVRCEALCVECDEDTGVKCRSSCNGRCSGTLRPDCVLFTEALPFETWVRAQMAAESMTEQDLCIVIGTSSAVYPAGYIPEIATNNGATVIEINMEETRFTKDYKPIFLKGGAEAVLMELFSDFCTSDR